MKRTLFLLLVSAFCGLLSLSAQNVAADYARRAQQLSAAEIPVPEKLTPDTAEREALRFLYAYMPWNDVCDYTPAYYLEAARYALRARAEMPWGSRVPEREWKHFVLPPRVNNENLDEFRSRCYKELYDRVHTLSMREAVLEVNHWCHEYVTYKPSDERTSSPLASMRTGTGRCGEESTYTVAALRTVGIPARQVYTPRWAHTDDNHAWVEAWVDGAWYFFGACEPEAVLNLGWFNAPASRGMLMHTKVFGAYDGPEDVISRTATYTEINVTSNYARTARTTVQVVNEKGKAVPNARVEFKLYNYGELYTVYNTRANEQGEASILSGLGDLVAWASDEASGRYGFQNFTVQHGGKPVKVVLNRKPGQQYSCTFNLTPPKGENNMPDVPAEAAALCKKRFLQEDSIRTAYLATFPDSAFAQNLCQELGLSYQRVWPLVQKSCGNWGAVEKILRLHQQPRTLDVLESLTDKDLRDFDCDVLSSHLTSLEEARDESHNPYVYSPRIANEGLTPWHAFFRKHFSAEEAEQFRADPSRLAAHINQRVRTDQEYNPLNYTLSPVRAYQTGIASERNKGILFVAAARSLGICARRDAVTGKVQWATTRRTVRTSTAEDLWEWHDVSFHDAAATAVPAPTAKQKKSTTSAASLRLAYSPRLYMENPRYYNHFTLSRLNNGHARLQEYPEEDTWSARWSEGESVDAGDYLLTSGTRLADGTVLVQLEAFPVKGATKATLLMREDEAGAPIIGAFNAENRYTDAEDGTVRSLLSKTGRGYYVAALIRANHEPTNHILHDLSAAREALEAWGRPILLLFPSQDERERFEKNCAEFKNLPSTVHFGVDTEGDVAADLKAFRSEAAELPAVVLADTFNRVVFFTHGYTIGLGEQLKAIIAKLEK